jgi:inosose dehydratase
MRETAVTRRTFNQLLTLSAAATATLSLSAQGAKRRLVVGHTGITWPGRGGAARAGAPGPAATPAASPGAAPPPVSPTGPPTPSPATPGAGLRRGGPPLPPDPGLNEAIFRDVSALGFAGLELFDWQITGLENQGVLAGFVNTYKLPLVSSYTSVNLTDPTQRANTIAAAVTVGQILKKYGGKTIVIGPSGRVGGATYNFNEHKQNIVTTLNELGKAITDIGLIAALHQHTGTAVETRDETYATMEAVDTRYVKFGPDIGQLQKGGVDPVEVVRAFLPVVQHMHVKDWVGGQAMAGYCALGLGKVDLVKILDLMDGRTISGMLMVELDSGGQMPYTPREGAGIARDWLVAQGVPMRA